MINIEIVFLDIISAPHVKKQQLLYIDFHKKYFCKKKIGAEFFIYCPFDF